MCSIKDEFEALLQLTLLKSFSKVAFNNPVYNYINEPCSNFFPLINGTNLSKFLLQSMQTEVSRLRSSCVEQNESLQNFFNWTRNWRTNPVKNCVIAWNWRVNICRKKQPRVSAIYHQVKLHLSYELNNLDKVVHGSFSRHDTTGTTRKEYICDTSQPANESKHRP